ncbi:MAG: MFS transporter [Bacteroidaceae bacterium]|nr:MFS transporter [Bacteroidaceae bacterium]
MKTINESRPYSWVPSLYLGEALPFSAVMLISVIMFKEMGLRDGQITLYTGWLGLPWVIKPIWSPIIDNLKTKRWWIVSMQFFMGIALALVAFTLPTNFWLQGSLVVFMLIAFASATHDISADGFYIIGLPDKEQELYVGVRNTFYRIGMVIGQGGLVLLAGYLQTWAKESGNSDFSFSLFPYRFSILESFHFSPISISWIVVFLILGILMFLLGLYHAFILPKVETAVHDRFNFKEQLREFERTLNVFVTKPHLISALCFILLFRLPEGLLTKIVPLFLTRSTAEGGLAMSDVDFGFIYGTLGVIGLLLGGIVGGWAVSKWGLKKCLWPLVLCITLPDIVYVYLSYVPTDQVWLIGTCVCIEQIGYGLGFAAYTLFLVHFSRGERSTAVFSICTAGQYFGGVMLPGMVSGLISENIGYQNFFWLVMAFCLVTFAVTACVKIEAQKE